MTDRAQEIFEQTVDLSINARGEALDAACGDDIQLREQVESLLSANDEAGSFMGSPTVDHVAAYSEAAEQAGTTIGRYKLLEKIGTGGFGDVYMAQQLEPVKRRVAFKIIKLGMDTKQVVARFEAERQALALMDHPNIARVLDGGETASGRPYFVMELVRGDPITAYCDREKIPTKERLKLFQQVCFAIQHAHQKGVIHRDIKPNNVLVTVADGHPLVKVIDFGIAKATNSELTDKTLFTEFRQLIGTPQYMSPEQAERSGVDIDTRSDIYSLGVLLYEMLTGRTPVDPKSMKSAVWEELQRMIREEEPMKPSTLVTSLGSDSELVAKSRGTELSRLSTVLKGDLDWIVLKALEKDRTRRYGTASELADDVQRYLDDEAVTATPPSAGYKIRKMVRRHKAAIGAATALATALLLGLIGTTVTSIWAMRERDAAVEAHIEAVEAHEAAVRAETLAKEASVRADKQADLARRMAAMVGNPFREKSEADSLAKAWSADLEDAKASGRLSGNELLTQECQMAVWWWYQTQSPEATDLIEDLYKQVKQKIDPAESIYLSVVNTNILAHLKKYDDKTIADLYLDLARSLKILKPGEYEGLLPEMAVALCKAEREDEATELVDQYLALRSGPNPEFANPVVERFRLRESLGGLEEWGADHPKRYARLKELSKLAKAQRDGTSKPEQAGSSSNQIWEGTLDLGTSELLLRFDIARSDKGEFTGKLISVDQGNAVIPLSKMSFHEGTLTMEFAAAQAKFVGAMNPKNRSRCVGKWEQGGKSFDLTIERVKP